MGNCSSQDQGKQPRSPTTVEPSRPEPIPEVPDEAPVPDLVALGIGTILTDDEYRAVKKAYLEQKIEGKQHKEACMTDTVQEKAVEVSLEDLKEAEDAAEAEQARMIAAAAIKEALWTEQQRKDWEQKKAEACTAAVRRLLVVRLHDRLEDDTPASPTCTRDVIMNKRKQLRERSATFIARQAALKKQMEERAKEKEQEKQKLVEQLEQASQDEGSDGNPRQQE